MRALGPVVAVLIVIALFVVSIGTEDRASSVSATPDVTLRAEAFSWGWRFGFPDEGIEVAVEALKEEYKTRDSGLQIRDIAGGWQLATRTELHEAVRTFLKTKPSARLSLAALETLAVIAYKQPVTVPEILEIRGVQSASAIKTLLEKRLIVTKGHKETVGRPMQYGTSREFLIQFGQKDLSDLPAMEDFEDRVQ